jgi:hypothetical protein
MWTWLDAERERERERERNEVAAYRKTERGVGI